MLFLQIPGIANPPVDASAYVWILTTLTILVVIVVAALLFTLKQLVSSINKVHEVTLPQIGKDISVALQNQTKEFTAALQNSQASQSAIYSQLSQQIGENHREIMAWIRPNQRNGNN